MELSPSAKAYRTRTTKQGIKRCRELIRWHKSQVKWYFGFRHKPDLKYVDKQGNDRVLNYRAQVRHHLRNVRWWLNALSKYVDKLMGELP